MLSLYRHVSGEQLYSDPRYQKHNSKVPKCHPLLTLLPCSQGRRNLAEIRLEVQVGFDVCCPGCCGKPLTLRCVTCPKAQAARAVLRCQTCHHSLCLVQRRQAPVVTRTMKAKHWCVTSCRPIPPFLSPQAMLLQGASFYSSHSCFLTPSL